jgi:hypothetical protein
VKNAGTSMIATLSPRQCYRDDYRQKRDPIREDRLLSRVQAFWHAVDLLHGQSKPGCGDGSRNIVYDVLLGSGDRCDAELAYRYITV